MVAFRVVYAIHFVLGTFVALRLWPYPFAIFGRMSDLDIAFRDFFAASSISCLAVSWYFVWYGSINFAVRAEFPIVSTRTFAALVGAVYLGTGVLAGYLHNESLSQLAASRSGLVLAIAAMLSLATATAIALPKKKRDWELEKQRRKRVRDEQLDQMYRITNPRIRP